jgi:hypothetical protein
MTLSVASMAVLKNVVFHVSHADFNNKKLKNCFQGATTFSMVTLSIMTFSIKVLFVKLSTNNSA